MPASIDPQVSAVPIRVRYAETDRMGVVYHGRYLEWLEVGRVDLMRQTGISYRELEEGGIYFPVVEVWTRYRRPATFDDNLLLRTWYREVTPVRVTFAYELKDESGQVATEAMTVHAALGKDRGLTTIPGWILDRIKGHVVSREPARGRLRTRREES